MRVRTFSRLACMVGVVGFVHSSLAMAQGYDIKSRWQNYLAGKHASFSQFSAQQGQFSGALDFYFCRDGNFVGTSGGSALGRTFQRGLWSVTETYTDRRGRALLHITYEDNRIVPDTFHLLYDPAANSVALERVTAASFFPDESPCLRSLPPPPPF